MGRERECDRRYASPAQACVSTSIVEKRPPIGRITADHQADEDRMIAARHYGLLLALDMRHDAIQDRDPALVFPVADAAETAWFGSRERPRQRFLLGGQNIEDEMPPLLHRGVHVVTLFDRDEDERRFERDGRE